MNDAAAGALDDARLLLEVTLKLLIWDWGS